MVLDEPNSNLDREGEQALTQAIVGVRARGGIVVVVAHRPSALAGVDILLAMLKGRPLAIGPKEPCCRRRPPQAARRAGRVVPTPMPADAGKGVTS